MSLYLYTLVYIHSEAYTYRPPLLIQEKLQLDLDAWSIESHLLPCHIMPVQEIVQLQWNTVEYSSDLSCLHIPILLCTRSLFHFFLSLLIPPDFPLNPPSPCPQTICPYSQSFRFMIPPLVFLSLSASFQFFPHYSHFLFLLAPNPTLSLNLNFIFHLPTSCIASQS